MFYLPPKQKEFSLWGTCSNHCLEAAGNDNNITLFAGMAHGHKYLKSLTLSKVTKNDKGEVAAVEQVFGENNYDRMYQGKTAKNTGFGDVKVKNAKKKIYSHNF